MLIALTYSLAIFLHKLWEGRTIWFCFAFFGLSMEVRNSLLRRKRTLEKIFHLKIFHFNTLQELEEQVQQFFTVLCYRKQEQLGETHVGNYNVYFYAFSSNSQHDFNTRNINIPGASWYYNSDENWVPVARSSLSCALRPGHLGFISLHNQMYCVLSV